MSSAQVDRPVKVVNNAPSNNVNKKDTEKSRKLFNSQSHKKHKHEENRHFKFGRKRLQSFTGNGKFFPPYKRRKKEGAIIPPTKFLLGGNICDPLNLNSMQDEEINRAMNAVTPKSSPLPTPKHRKETIEVIIPPNICDPLNLTNCNDNDEEYEKSLISPLKKCTKRRNRKRKRASSGSGKEDTNDIQNDMKIDEIPPNSITIEISKSIIEETLPEAPPPIQSIPPSPKIEQSTKIIENKTTKDTIKIDSPIKDKNKLRLKGLDDVAKARLRKIDIKDKIVSPVIPQPGAWKTRLPHRTNNCEKKKKQPLQLPNFRQKDSRYQYGNYNRYYGYRNPNHEIDPRLNVFAQRKELFYGRDVLDIGCNIGHITLSVARDFAAHSVTGIDIDRKLIGIARKNIKHYVNCVRSPASNQDDNDDVDDDEAKDCDTSFFPMSMPINYGPIDVPGFSKKQEHKGFPYNVTFVQGNYVLEDDSLLTSEQPQFDVILCLSLTKWIHLNFGDAGLKQAFKRMHAQLRPGGVLILEAQSWSSYGKKKSLTERMYRNYHSIEFFPQKFTQYLLSADVGFTKCEVVSIPPHPSKGFQRPIQLFTKAGTSPAPPTAVRFMGRKLQRRETDKAAYDRELFPNEQKYGNFSDLSQRSVESLSQYEQLENVYAPSTTPCYDTPSHYNDSQSAFDNEKIYYTDIDTKANEQDKNKDGKINELSNDNFEKRVGNNLNQDDLHDNNEIKIDDNSMDTSKNESTIDNT